MIISKRLGAFAFESLIYSFSIYKYPYNINKEEHASYLKKVQTAEKVLEQQRQASVIPRRKRRLYDKPKHDLDITKYTAWRLYDPQQMFYKFWAHGAPVVAKLRLQPKWVIHAFGIGLPPLNHQKSASLEFSFEDNNFSKFLLYEYRNTTLFKQNVPDYDYQNQDHIPQKRRLTRRLSYEQFWASEDYFQFRLNASAYAQHLKFKKWIEHTVQASKTKESYDEFINKKYGEVITYNKKEDMKAFVPATPAILSLTPNHFNLPKKGQKLKEPKVQLPKKLGQQHRIISRKIVAQETANKKLEEKAQS